MLISLQCYLLHSLNRSFCIIIHINLLCRLGDSNRMSIVTLCFYPQSVMLSSVMVVFTYECLHYILPLIWFHTKKCLHSVLNTAQTLCCYSYDGQQSYWKSQYVWGIWVMQKICVVISVFMDLNFQVWILIRWNVRIRNLLWIGKRKTNQ